MVSSTRDEFSHRITVAEFNHMLDAGVFGADPRLELIDGEICEMPDLITPSHGYGVDGLAMDLTGKLLGRAVVRVQGLLLCGEFSQLLPDVYVARLPRDQYLTRNPTSDDVLLLAEVAQSSVIRDRNRKTLLYSRGGVPEVWLIDVPGCRIEVYTEPSDDGYAAVKTYFHGDVLIPTAFPDVEVPVSEALPPC